MSQFLNLPRGFKFDPSDEVLVDYLNKKKIGSISIEEDIIKEIDFYGLEPWEIPELCKTGIQEENRWFFFSLNKRKKSACGTSCKRSTEVGFWKATGRDKEVYSRDGQILGMRKTLVFHKRGIRNGERTEWIVHEFRCPTQQEEGWVCCKLFKKKTPMVRTMRRFEAPEWQQQSQTLHQSGAEEQADDHQAVDWKFLEDLLASE